MARAPPKRTTTVVTAFFNPMLDDGYRCGGRGGREDSLGETPIEYSESSEKTG